MSALRALRQKKGQRRFDRIVIGVITNSDDRVPTVLSAFGFNVSPLRYGTNIDLSAVGQHDYDIDFHCMSYDVGVEKPDKQIFTAAELMLTQLLAARDGKGPSEAKADAETWQKVYVGDEHSKDVVGAMNAGWNPILLDADTQPVDIPRLEELSNKTLDDLFKEHAVVRVKSIQNLSQWLIGN